MTITVLLLALSYPASRGAIHFLRHPLQPQKVRLIGIDSHQHPLEAHQVDEWVQCDGADIPFLLDLCQQKRVSVVLPFSEPQVLMLAKHRSAFEEIGTRVMASPLEVLQQVSNKASLLEAIQAHGLPVPSFHRARTWQEVWNGARALGYPERDLILKPSQGWGCRGVKRISSQGVSVEQLFSARQTDLPITLEALREMVGDNQPIPELLLMELLEGDEYSVDLFRGQHLELAVPRKRDRLILGVAGDTKVEMREDIIQLSLEVSRRLDLRYLVGLQFKCNQAGEPMILECNPRIQGTILGANVNLVWLAVQELLGDPPTEIPDVDPSTVFRRSWGGVLHTQAGIKEV